MQYRRISADGHIDLNWLPADLFVSEAPQAFKDRMPFVDRAQADPVWVTRKGAHFGLVNGIGPSGKKFIPGSSTRIDGMEVTGLFSDGIKGIRRVTDPHMRVRDMEYDGVDAEVLYGLLGIGPRMRDPAATVVVLRIYNDWLHGFCSHYPERHLGLAALPGHDVNAAVAEIHRVAKMGFCGLDLAVSHDMESMAHAMWEPLWLAVAEVDLPLHFHNVPYFPPDHVKRFAGHHLQALNFQVTAEFQMSLAGVISSVMGSCVLERYPNIRIAFGECGIGWLPYLLDRMDVMYEDVHRDIGLKMRPSEYWRRQCRATFQYDRVGARMAETVGAETLMWSCDFPHIDGVWPNSQESIDEQFGHLPADVVRKITCGNAARFYGLAQ